MKLIEKRNYDTLMMMLAWMIFIAFLVFTIQGEDGLIKLFQLKKTRHELTLQNRSLMMENLSLRQEQKSLYNLKTIEHVARSTLGLVYPDEVVFIVPKEN